ncbi:MAG: hypothetical protein QXO70_03800 [Candidatus Pacearchaeota archaeon]
MKVVFLFLLLFTSCMEAKRHILDESTPQGALIRRLLSLRPVPLPEIPTKIRFLVGANSTSKTLSTTEDWTNWEIKPVEPAHPLPNCITLSPNGVLQSNCVSQIGNWLYYKGEHIISAQNQNGEKFEKTVTIEVASPVTPLESSNGIGFHGSLDCPRAVIYQNELHLLYFDGNLSNFYFQKWNAKSNTASSWTSLASPPYINSYYLCPELVTWQDKIYLFYYDDSNYPNFDIQIYAYNETNWSYVTQSSPILNSSSYFFRAIPTEKFILFYISEFGGSSRFFKFLGSNLEEIQSLPISFQHFSATTYQSQILLASHSSASTHSIYSLNPNLYNWDFSYSWGGILWNC